MRKMLFAGYLREKWGGVIIQLLVEFICELQLSGYCEKVRDSVSFLWKKSYGYSEQFVFAAKGILGDFVVRDRNIIVEDCGYVG